MSTATLVIRQPGHRAREFEISGDEVSIGRALDNTLCLEGDSHVSLYHAAINANSGGFRLTDLGSDAGTTVNDEPVEFTHRLRDGDIITVGEDVTIEFYFEESQQPPRESDGESQAAHASRGRNPLPFIVGVVAGLALTAVLAAALAGKFYARRQSGVPLHSAQNINATAADNSPAPERPPTVASSVDASKVEPLVSELARRISGESAYIFDREFLGLVQARTAVYLDEGCYERARRFRDVINEAFVGEQGLAAPLGYALALSRSRFNATQATNAQGGVIPLEAGEGLWQFPSGLAHSTGYIGMCGDAALSDADQKCAARVSAAYLKFLTIDIFAGDFVYAVACFGMSPKDAAQFRDHLPADRRDFWKVLKSPAQRARVVDFFAAGVVGENPQKFGLDAGNSLANLYPKN